MSPLVRYSLLQIPALVFVGLVLAILYEYGWLHGPGALLVLGLWLAKDILFYRFYALALENDLPTPGPRQLIGCPGISKTPINGRGLVEIAGERWMACSDDGSEIGPGTPIEVTGCEGMLLHVRAQASG